MSSTCENRHWLSRAARARLLSVLCALAAVLASPLARAAAPMCNDDATSVAAPPIVMPTDNGKISAAPSCNDKGRAGLILDKAPGPEHGTSSFGAESPLRALPLGIVWPTPQRSAPLPIEKGRLLPARAGFQSSVYRPPRT